MTTLRNTRRRTPAGFLYPFPPRRRDPEAAATSAFVEAGWLASRGEEGEARFREYLDASDGLWIRRFGFDHRAGSGGLSIDGGAVGRDDAFYRLTAGATNRFLLRAAYDSVDHTYADDAQVLFTGVGGEQLRLPTGLVPGANSQADLDAVLATLGRSRLSQSRNESSVELRARLDPRTVVTATYRLERRDGERPWGGTLGLPFGATNVGSVVETLEPIHSRTHDWSAQLEWGDERTSVNLGYWGSHFDNRRESLVWENPFAATDLGFLLIPGEPLGRMALAPDNMTHRLAVDASRATLLRGRLTASASWARMAQDETLLPATLNSAVTDFDVLARRRADARVDLLRVQAEWRVRPMRRLSLSLGGRFTQRDSDTRYMALNPTTGEFGYVVEDLVPTRRVGAVPYSHRKLVIEGKGDWRLAPRTRVGVEYAHQRMHRSGRARRETVDDRARIAFTTRAAPGSTHRIAYEHRHRSGSGYDPTRDNAFYAPAPGATTLAGASRSLRSFRQFDLARHTSHGVDVRSNFLLDETVDLAFTARWMDRDYGATHGLQREQLVEVGLDGNYQPRPSFDVRAFGSFEWRSRRLKTIDSEPGVIGSLDPGGPTFPLVNAWSWESRSRTFVVGAGSSWRPTEAMTLSLEYRFQATDESTSSGFDRGGGALSFGVDPSTAATSLPIIRLRDHLVEFSATRNWRGPIETTLFYRVQVSEFEDAHQRAIVPRVNQTLFLAHRDRDYVAHVFGSTATLRF